MSIMAANLLAKREGVARLIKSQRRFSVGDLIKIDPETRQEPDILELLNEFGGDSASAIFEVANVREPLGGPASDCPQTIFIVLRGESDVWEQSSDNFVLAGQD